ncbi:hypothetical protein ACQKO6_17855 [Pseudomonas monteilii]
MQIKIDHTSGDNPRPLVEKLVANRDFPFLVGLQHRNVLPVVVPSSGINAALQPGETHSVKLKSFQQAWCLVTDLSEYASRTNNTAEDYATVTASEVESTANVQAPAPVAAPKATKEKAK